MKTLIYRVVASNTDQLAHYDKQPYRINENCGSANHAVHFTCY